MPTQPPSAITANGTQRPASRSARKRVQTESKWAPIME